MTESEAIMEGRPNLTLKDAESLAGSLFQIEATASDLPSDRDRNFKLTTSSGEYLVLKVFNSLEEKARIDLQAEATNSLAEVGLPVARVLRQSSIELGTQTHQVRIISWLEGTPLGLIHPLTPDLEFEIGVLLARSDSALKEISTPIPDKAFTWDLAHAEDIIGSNICALSEEDGLLVKHFLNLYRENVRPVWETLPTQLIHNDANDFNLLVDGAESEARSICGLLDFGDLVYSARIGNVAIAAAYLALHRPDPVDAMCTVLQGYHSEAPVSETEASVLFALSATRLATSVCVSAARRVQELENAYLSISEEDAWACLRKLKTIHPRLATYRIRAALGLEPVPGSLALENWLALNRESFSPVIFAADPKAEPVVFDFSVSSLEFDPEAMGDPRVAEKTIWDRSGDAMGIGRWCEPRIVYTGDQYATLSGERRTIHIGADLFRPALTAVHAPLEGSVHSLCAHHDRYDYGGCVILEHQPEDGPKFWTLYGHLSHDSVAELHVGQHVEKGREFARLGDFEENGGWVPHLHFQIVTDMIGLEGTFPGVAAPSAIDTWTSLSPSPVHLLSLANSLNFEPPPNSEELMIRRSRLLGSSLSVSYKNKLHIVRGVMQYLFDAEGRPYLDAVNNVPLVGHSNPRVVRALHEQMRTLTTNTRYLHQNILDYAERLTATLPDPLDVCFFLNSGSEANDLALRLARTYTGKRDMIVLEGGYHGNLTSLIDISPYKFEGPGGTGKPAETDVVPMPDTYRGEHRGMTSESGLAYAEYVREAGAASTAAAFIAESVPGVGGQIVAPPGFFSASASHIRAAGGLFIADEVQVGLGRVGTHFWGFQLADAGPDSLVPDIVVIGKPLGNGHPLAAVITTRSIAEAFNNGMEYFNTFGGNPASCAVGLAVLDEIERLGLQENARVVGEHLLSGLRRLMHEHAVVGDVRGVGLFIGVELVRNRETLEPADAEASYVANRMRDKGILISTDGPLHNVLKIKPPLVFTLQNADHLLSVLGDILSEDFVTARLASK